jgi:hypothetical protein
MINTSTLGWNKVDAQVFWGEIAPCDHVVQIYENDEVFLNLLGGFVTGGIRAGESVIVIATVAHLKALNERIEKEGFNLFDLMLKHQYIPLDAEETLAKFMINGWPDENLFRHTVTSLIQKAKHHKRHKVRAFGEMVALLWAQGLQGATVHLEHLWNDFMEREEFCLFCAYPKSGFTQNPHDSIKHICGTHSKVIEGMSKSNDIVFKEV